LLKRKLKIYVRKKKLKNKKTAEEGKGNFFIND